MTHCKTCGQRVRPDGSGLEAELRSHMDSVNYQINHRINEEVERRAKEWIEEAKGFDFAKKFIDLQTENIVLKRNLENLIVACEGIPKEYYEAANEAENEILLYGSPNGGEKVLI